MHRLTRIADWMSLARSANYNCRNLARVCGVSPGYLNQFFVGHFFRPPQEWLDEIRIWEAFRLLCEQTSVKEAAYSLGFKQISHFSRAFTQYHGFCPSQCAEVYFSTSRRYALNHASRFRVDTCMALLQITPPWVRAEVALSLRGERFLWRIWHESAVTTQTLS
jgi:AraC-like DNA-binding protein